MTQLKHITLREKSRVSEEISQSVLPGFSRLLAVIPELNAADKQNKVLVELIFGFLFDCIYNRVSAGVHIVTITI